MNGILNVYKEPGFTSHDVVAKLRGICKQKKIGHTGTLDPEASGVLPVCLGNATKLCDLLTDKDKEYRAVLLLGVETDTQDTTGQILTEKEVNAGEEDVRSAILSFVGPYDQIPPMYSALKVNGQKLCDLARKGQVVERKSRRIMIHSIEIEDISLPRVMMRVSCSRGTYIRTLCHDIGQKLGCGGAMERLERTRSGNFKAEDAYRLSELEAFAKEGSLEEKLLPVESVFEQLDAYQVQGDGQKLLENGNWLYADLVIPYTKEKTAAACERGTFVPEQQLRIYDTDGQFTGIYAWKQEEKRLKPVKMFLGKEQ